MATGFIIRRSDARVVVVIPNLLEIDLENGSMRGMNDTAYGIDLQVAYVFAVEDAKLNLNPGDLLPEGYTDVSNKYVKQNNVELNHKKIADLLFENVSDKQKMASLESIVGDLLVDIAILKGER